MPECTLAGLRLALDGASFVLRRTGRSPGVWVAHLQRPLRQLSRRAASCKLATGPCVVGAYVLLMLCILLSL